MLLLAKKFARDIPALIGLVIVIVAITIAIIGPWIAPHPGDVVASHLTQRLKPPSAAFPFGTDNLGRDLLSRVILGTRGALEVALIVVALAAAIGARSASSPDTPAAGRRNSSCVLPTCFCHCPSSFSRWPWLSFRRRHSKAR